MDKTAKALTRLQELKAEHERITGDRPGSGPGFMEDEAIVRHSYRLVAEDGLQDGTLTEAALDAAGLPKALDQAEGTET